MKKHKLPVAVKTQNAESTELENISALIRDKIAVEKIICFGSVIKSISRKSCFTPEETNISEEELNSYCILIVPAADEKLADIMIQQRTEEALKHLACVTVIVHRMQEFNSALQNGSTFFTAVYKNGMLLYDKQEEPFIVPSGKVEVSKRIIRREKFWHQWFDLSNDFLIGARFYASKEKNNLAVFMLHQTLQHCYSGVLRVYIGYRTNTNGLRRLIKLIETAVPDYKLSSAKSSPEDARLSGLLLKGFGDARYNDKFEATNEEVATLVDRIADILQFANSSCLARIKDIKEGKTSYIA